MNVIQIEHNEVFEGIMHGFMHKGLNEEQNTHSPDVIYLSTSDRAADFEVKGILRKGTIPNNFFACGYSSLLHKLRGRSLTSIALIISPECLHIQSDLFTGALATVIESRGSARPEWHKSSTLIVHGPHTQTMVSEIQMRLYKNYRQRNPMFVQGSTELVSNISLEEFARIVADSTLPTNLETKTPRIQFFFGEEFAKLDMHIFYQDLQTLHTLSPAGDNLVFAPKVLFMLYSQVLSNLRTPAVSM